ncbi:uncharacterized protein LOC130737925 [Lotus japonicus]|uniref:uncharacterized protein LOC130737925 n=1 Tax=Lotus japonicus TaxID=34305 RepID=UPI00258941FA|nr:uncharacterized protein LOC130737925 [Lotus japonicus]
MDCTYKTNKYRIPLLEMVGLTSTGKTFSIAFCYMTQERTHDYVWALDYMKSLLTDPVRLPGVIVTDKELALMNAVSQTFPTSCNLLCLFHIKKAVEAKCKLWVAKDDFKDIVMEQWTDLVNAETEQQYEKEWRNMCAMCKDHPKFTKYISETWLTHKEKFVKAWTNNVMHFGNTTSNRAESAHAAFKKMLRNSKGNLCDSWDAVDRLTTVRHNEIVASFERSINIVEHRFKSKMYVNVRGFVAEKALQLMHDEQNRGWGRDEVCGCLMKVTHGLPCTCALQSYVSIPYKVVDPFWKILSWEQVPVPDRQTSNRGDIQYDIEALVAHYSTLDDAGQSMLRRKVKELYCPQSSSLCPPEVKIKTKQSSKAKGSKPPTCEPIGSLRREPSHWELNESNATPTLAKCPPPTIRSRNRSSQASKSKNKNSIGKSPPPSIYLGYLPSFFLPYIDEVIDVVGDGNCGYRAVAALLGHPEGQNGWHSIREKLMEELEHHQYLYNTMWGFDIVQALHFRLTLPHDQMATDDKWMPLPEMGYLIATRFQVVFISISERSSYTYLPLIGAPPEVHTVIAVGHVPNHYVQLKLLHGHPIPYIAPQWPYNVLPPTTEWINPNQDRMARFALEHTAWRAAIGGPLVPNVNDYIDITKD